MSSSSVVSQVFPYGDLLKRTYIQSDQIHSLLNEGKVDEAVSLLKSSSANALSTVTAYPATQYGVTSGESMPLDTWTGYCNALLDCPGIIGVKTLENTRCSSWSQAVSIMTDIVYGNNPSLSKDCIETYFRNTAAKAGSNDQIVAQRFNVSVGSTSFRFFQFSIDNRQLKNLIYDFKCDSQLPDTAEKIFAKNGYHSLLWYELTFDSII